MSSGSFMSGLALSWRAPRPAPGAAAGTLCLAVLASACGARHPAPPAADEQVLNIYNWADYIGHDTVAEFERQGTLLDHHQTAL